MNSLLNFNSISHFYLLISIETLVLSFVLYRKLSICNWLVKQGRHKLLNRSILCGLALLLASDVSNHEEFESCIPRNQVAKALFELRAAVCRFANRRNR